MSTRTPSSPRALLFALLAFVALSSPAGARAADDDPMAPYRERFKTGMERYKAGDLPAAIADWESIYREVGPEKGYRIAFDLARAYDKAGDSQRAADRYDAFVRIVDKRRAEGVTIEPIVLQEENEARARLASIVREPPIPSPTPEPSPTPVAPPVPAPVSTPTPVPAPVPVPAPGPIPNPAPVAAPSPPHHPFSPIVLVASGGATVVAIAVCAVEYANALSDENAFNAAAGQSVGAQTNLRSTYDGTRPIAYGFLGASVGLAALTSALTIWYFAGTKTQEPSITPVASPVPGGAQAGIVGRF